MSVFRIDRFEVPAAVAAEFLVRIRETHAILHGCDGFLGDRIFVERAGHGILTLAEWRDDAAIEAAKARVQAARRSTGFDPVAFMQAAGITSYFATFAPASDGPLASG